MDKLINGNGNGIAYYGLCDVSGGKLWYVHTMDGAQYFGTKKEALAVMKNAGYCKEAIKDLKYNCHGRAYILN